MHDPRQAWFMPCYLCDYVISHVGVEPEYPRLCPDCTDMVRDTDDGAQRFAEAVAARILQARWAAGQPTVLHLMILAAYVDKARGTVASPRLAIVDPS